MERIGAEQHLFYTGYDCTWGKDALGDRFHKIDKKTRLPLHWENAKAIEIIQKFVGARKNKSKYNKKLN